MSLIINRSKQSSIQAAPADPPRKRPVSESRVQANRRNALRATGPRTARGKRTASRNAIKHGLLAREVVIRAGNGHESLEEFQGLLGNLSEFYEPVDVVEESLVQTIATCLWRKARVLRAENGEIHTQLNTLASDQTMLSLEAREALSRTEEILHSAERRASEKKSRTESLQLLRSAQRNLPDLSMGRLYLSELLQVAKSEVAMEGHISMNTAERILLAFGLWDQSFADACAASSANGREIEPSTGVGDKEASDERTLILGAIDARLEMISLFEKQAEEYYTLAEPRRLSLPPSDVIDKIIRYESHLDRQLYRAMDQLERLQRHRSGENVPPPLNIKLQ